MCLKENLAFSFSSSVLTKYSRNITRIPLIQASFLANFWCVLQEKTVSGELAIQFFDFVIWFLPKSKSVVSSLVLVPSQAIPPLALNLPATEETFSTLSCMHQLLRGRGGGQFSGRQFNGEKVSWSLKIMEYFSFLAAAKQTIYKAPVVYFSLTL